MSVDYAWRGVEYTNVYRPDQTVRSAGGLRYSAPHPFTDPAPHQLAVRRPARNGEPVAPYVSRLAGLPPRTSMDWSGLVNGKATAYNTRLRDHLGRPELFMPNCFAADDGIEVPLLLVHDYDRHVGWATLHHRRDGLYFSGQLNRDGRQRVGTWRGLSIGFSPTSVSLTPHNSSTRRHYTGKVWELSICDRGAHHPHSYLELVGETALAA